MIIETNKGPEQITHAIKSLNETESAIVDAALVSILAGGFKIAVFDSEEFATGQSVDADEIRAEVGATDETSFYVYDASGKGCGYVYFVHGNGPHVLTDYTLNLEKVLAPAMATADKLGA